MALVKLILIVFAQIAAHVTAYILLLLLMPRDDDVFYSVLVFCIFFLCPVAIAITLNRRILLPKMEENLRILCLLPLCGIPALFSFGMLMFYLK